MEYVICTEVYRYSLTYTYTFSKHKCSHTPTTVLNTLHKDDRPTGRPENVKDISQTPGLPPSSGV